MRWRNEILSFSDSFSNPNHNILKLFDRKHAASSLHDILRRLWVYLKEIVEFSGIISKICFSKKHQ
jgi:hypothetical protein